MLAGRSSRGRLSTLPQEPSPIGAGPSCMTPKARRPEWRRATVPADLRTMLIACLLSLFLPACTSTLPPRAVERSGSPNPAASEAPPPLELRIGLDVDADGWVVLPEWFGVWVAGGGTLSEIDQDSGEVRRTGTGRWDYDHVQLARYGEGTILLATGSTLWSLNASSGVVVQRNDLEHLGSLDAVINTRSGTWVAASEHDGGVLARIDLDTGAASRRIRIGHGRHEIVRSAGYLVVASQDSTRPGVVRVDPRTGEKMTLRWSTGSIASVGYRVWVATGEHVHCIDVLDGTSCGVAPVPGAVSVASDGAGLWVLSATGSTSTSTYQPDPDRPATVTLIDGVNGELMGGPLALPSITPATISAFEGHAWIGFHDGGRVIRIDCRVGRCVVPGWVGRDQST
jgi:hypothetical protein